MERHIAILMELGLAQELNLLNLINVSKIGHLKVKIKVYLSVSTVKTLINILELQSVLLYLKASCPRQWMEVIHALH